MIEKSKSADASTSPRHPQKAAVDAHGADPMAPSEALLERIAAVLKTGKKDEVVVRWAKAFNVVCPEPSPSMPHAVLLSKIIGAIDSGKRDAEVTSAMTRLLNAAKQTPQWTAAVNMGVF